MGSAFKTRLEMLRGAVVAGVGERYAVRSWLRVLADYRRQTEQLRQRAESDDERAAADALLDEIRSWIQTVGGRLFKRRDRLRKTLEDWPAVLRMLTELAAGRAAANALREDPAPVESDDVVDEADDPPALSEHGLDRPYNEYPQPRRLVPDRGPIPPGLERIRSRGDMTAVRIALEQGAARSRDQLRQDAADCARLCGDTRRFIAIPAARTLAMLMRPLGGRCPRASQDIEARGARPPKECLDDVIQQARTTRLNRRAARDARRRQERRDERQRNATTAPTAAGA